MLRRTTTNSRASFSMQMDSAFISPRKRLVSDFMYKGEGKTNSGFKQPYRIWSWKQRELFRNIQEEQFEHMRRIYKRQWYEAYRVNASEYLYKYNITKAAQLVQWENEMEAQESKRKEAYHRSAGRQALKAKHTDLLREYHEKEFFHWYERASERLQYMSQTMKFVQKEDIDEHINRELDKYVHEPNKSYPLNFAGQMPLLENRDGQVVAASGNNFTRVSSEFPGLEKFDPPSHDPKRASASTSSYYNISGDLRSLEDGGGGGSSSGSFDDDVIAAQVVEQMAQEQQQHVDDEAATQSEGRVSDLDEETYQAQRRAYLDRGSKAGPSARRLQFKAKQASKQGATSKLQPASHLETIADTDTTIAEASKKARQAMSSEREKSSSRKQKQQQQSQQSQKEKNRVTLPATADEIDLENISAATKSEKYLLQRAKETRAERSQSETEMQKAMREAVREGMEKAETSSDNRGQVAKATKLAKPKITEELLDRLMQNEKISGAGGGGNKKQK